MGETEWEGKRKNPESECGGGVVRLIDKHFFDSLQLNSVTTSFSHQFLFSRLPTMADADEDTARLPATGSEQIETDLSDETQDFRLLNHLNLYVPST
jgi:hypothetical protein